MAISSTRIAQMALSHIGEKTTIESLDENDPGAHQCKLWYDFSLQQALEIYDWSFARKREALALAGDAAPDQWTYRYQYPTLCVKARRIWNPAGDDADAVPFDMETDSNDSKTILTDMQSAILVYTKLVTNPVAYSAFFVEMLSRALAQHIAFPLTGKTDVTKAQADAFQQLAKLAPAYDANERVGKPPRDAPWVRGRNHNPYFDRCR